MCFNKTTKVTQTGLGDDQYASLFGQNEGIGKQVEEGFVGAGEKLDGISGEVSGIGGKITDAKDAINTNTNTGFTDLTGIVKGYGDTLTQGQSDAVAGRAKYYNDMLAALENNTGGLATQASLDSGFSDATGRFNDIDQANTNIQTAVDQGFVDAQGDRDQMSADMTSAFDTQNTGLNTAFNTLGTEVGTAFDTTNANIDTTRGNLEEGQAGLVSDLSTLSGSVDTYGAGLTQGQADLQSGQDTFKSSFDDYVDRYTEDTEIANTARADRALAAANQNDALREDIGRYAQAAAEGQSNIGKKIGTLGDATGAGFEVLSGAVEGGFSDVAAGDQVAKNTLANRISGVRDLLQTTSDNLDSSTKAQYSALADSFDANGDLITNAIDSQGNTIQRSMDDQGRILESRFDSTGTEISSVQMDVETMLSNADTYQNSLMGGLSSIQKIQEGGFGDIQSAIGTGFGDLGTELSAGFDIAAGSIGDNGQKLLQLAANQQGIDSVLRDQAGEISTAFDVQGNLIRQSTDDLGNTIIRNIDDSGNLITRKLDSQGNALGDQTTNIRDLFNQLSGQSTSLSDQLSRGFSDVDNRQQGIMSETAATNEILRDQGAALAAGFDTQSNKMDTTIRDLARVASAQTDIDMGTRQEFKQLSDAFDDQGNLIANSVGDNGNTISRAIDNQGNLLLRAFDTQGRAMGDKVIDINRSLMNLRDLSNISGANAGMGNLSPAMQAGSGGAVTSGFMSPYATTR